MMKISTAKLASVLLLALGTAWAPTSSALVPAGITQQGRILADDGTPLDGDVTIVFTIYDDPEAAEEANVLWTESQSIALEDGYFSTRLGEDEENVFPATLFDGSVRYLGVTVGADDEMTPRQTIGSVPYALVANDAIGDINPTSVTVNGNVVIDANGDWQGNAVDRPFTSLLTRRTTSATGQNLGLITTVTCAAGERVTGGGCNVIPTGDGETSLKDSYPNTTLTGWSCSCSGNDNCNLEIIAICAAP